jgi:phosphonoacetaldehyde hydrolase
MLKRDHIKAILEMPRVGELWLEKHGKAYTDENIDKMHDNFETHLMASLLKHNNIINGVPETVETLREKGIKIGSTTGYTKKMMAVVQKDAEKKGYKPDSVVTPDDVGFGRPNPFMIHQNMKNLGVFPPSTIIKVGDTESDMAEGVNAGVISVGVLVGSSMMGLSELEYESLPKDQRKQARKKAEAKFYKAGADYVIKDITLLPKLINKINKG